MKKIDLILGFLVGEGVAFLFLWLLKKQGISVFFPFFNLLIIFSFPILAIFGIYISFLIGKKFLFVYQLTKFSLIGAFFALIDLTVLNFLMEWLKITREAQLKYTLFATISFVIATILKYFGDKYWAFEKKEKEKMHLEFTLFFVITLISGFIQVGIASFLFKTFSFFNPFVAGNLAKIGGIFVASIWNFLGYKFLVFKK
jgi:putative flippase GtrA